MTTETDEAEYHDMDMDENLKLPQKHLLPPIEQEESKKKKSTPFFSDLSEEKLTAIFGEGLRLQLCQMYITYDAINRDLNLCGTIQVAPDFSPDPLLQNSVFYVMNREFNNPIRANSLGHGELRDLSFTSFPVSSTSVVHIAAKLYVTTDKPDDVEIYIDDCDRGPTEFEAVFNKTEKELVPKFQTRTFSVKRPFDNEVFHVCDEQTLINISERPECGPGEVTFEGKDGSLRLSYVVFKYAIDAHLKIEFVPTSKLKNVTGTVLVYYPAYCEYIKLFEYRSSTTYITAGKMNLIRSVLAVPANSSFIIEAQLHENTTPPVEILLGAYEFHVPHNANGSAGIIKGNNCSLKLKVKWKLPSEERKIPSVSHLSLSEEVLQWPLSSKELTLNELLISP